LLSIVAKELTWEYNSLFVAVVVVEAKDWLETTQNKRADALSAMVRTKVFIERNSPWNLGEHFSSSLYERKLPDVLRTRKCCMQSAKKIQAGNSFETNNLLQDRKRCLNIYLQL
jgi:hypothetical protein